MPRLFGTNGIRGVINQEMTPELALGIGKALGTYLKKNKVQPKLAIGTDARLSNAMLATAVTSGLLSTGCTVVDLGLVPTPTLQYTVKEKKYDAGVIITASHNPPEFNGIKGVSSTGAEFTQEIEQAIEQIYFQNHYTQASWDMVGQYSTDAHAIDRYLKAITTLVDVARIKKQKFRVVLDCGNGVGSLAAPALLKHLGCTVTSLNCNPDGRFPGRPSEPLPENLTCLIDTVMKENADVGVALDGDADRAIFIDEQGKYIWGDKTLSLLGKHIVIRNQGGIVVTPVTTSTCFEDTIKAHHGQVIYTRVGSPVVASAMMHHHAVFGGEENGGLIFPSLHYCRDACMSIASLLELLSQEKKPLSALIAQLPEYEMYKTKIPCPNLLKECVVQKLASHIQDMPDIVNVDQTDGIKIYTQQGWILLRPSGTEPIFRIYAEAHQKDIAEKIAETYKKLVQEIINHLKNASNDA
ncbi:MAG: phosphoglucosamine mutase [Candidatus Thermoplasmatota archaeon]